MDLKIREEFKKFLEMQEGERLEFLTGVNLTWWQRIKLKIMNKWWTSIRKQNSNLSAIELYESIRKGRF